MRKAVRGYLNESLKKISQKFLLNTFEILIENFRDTGRTLKIVLEKFLKEPPKTFLKDSMQKIIEGSQNDFCNRPQRKVLENYARLCNDIHLEISEASMDQFLKSEKLIINLHPANVYFAPSEKHKNGQNFFVFR